MTTTMEKVPDEGTVYDQYFEWLYGRVASLRAKNPEFTHWKLMRKLYSTPFEWYVPNDDNRAAHGVELRLTWMKETGQRVQDRDWLELTCSMLELLIALADRLTFEAGGAAGPWFWKLVENLGLKEYTDDIYEISIEEEVTEVLDRLINRTYERDGSGGLFPVSQDPRDQRKVEILYQMSSYLLEGDFINIGPRSYSGR